MTLPNLLMLGPGRVGSTSIDRYLRQHPQVFLCPNKEPRFFSYAQRRPAHAGPDGEELNLTAAWRRDMNASSRNTMSPSSRPRTTSSPPR